MTTRGQSSSNYFTEIINYAQIWLQKSWEIYHKDDNFNIKNMLHLTIN